MKEPEASSLKTLENKSDNQSGVAPPLANDIIFLSSVKTNEPFSAHLVTISTSSFQGVSYHACDEIMPGSPRRSPQQCAKGTKGPVKKVPSRNLLIFPLLPPRLHRSFFSYHSCICSAIESPTSSKILLVVTLSFTI